MEYIVIREVDNGWVIERNPYASSGSNRETLVCTNGRVVTEHIERMLCGDVVTQEAPHGE